MPKTKEQKRDILHALRDKVAKSKSIVFAKFSGLEVKDNEALRRSLRAENSEYYVAKKTLLGIALKEKGIEVDAKSLDGQVAAIFGFGDEVAPAKVINTFQKNKENEGKIEFVGGILENKLLSKEEVTALSKLPSKQELLGRLVGSLNAPVSGFVNVLAGNLRNLVYVLKAIESKK